MPGEGGLAHLFDRFSALAGDTATCGGAAPRMLALAAVPAQDARRG